MRRAVALALTLVLIAGALYLGRGVSARPSSSAASPAACLEQMYLAAERGDVEAYLDCFTGAQRERLETELRAGSREVFAKEIAASVNGLKGRAINGPGQATIETDRARLEAERIYGQHAERQAYDFRREAGVWRIESLGAIQRFQPLIPYGTPVYTAPVEPAPSAAAEK